MRLMPAGQDKSTGFADVSPLIAAVPCVVDRTAQAGAAPPPKALQIDSGAAARALDSIGKHAKGRAASGGACSERPAAKSPRSQAAKGGWCLGNRRRRP